MGVEGLSIHPSVGLWLEPGCLTPRQRAAAVAKVRCLEHDLFESGNVDQGWGEGTLARINELRRALGWLEVDLSGHLRWPDLDGPQAGADQLVGVAGT